MLLISKTKKEKKTKCDVTNIHCALLAYDLTVVLDQPNCTVAQRQALLSPVPSPLKVP